MSRVVVVGSLNADLVLRVASIPRPGQTVLAGSVLEGVGGKGGNQAIAAARAGAEVAMVGAVGEDTAGQLVLGTLGAQGIDLAGVRRVAGPTGLAVVLVEESGENAITVAPGANDTCSAVAVAESLATLAAGDIVVTQAEIPLAAVEAAGRAARAAGATLVLNLAPYRPVPDALLATAAVLVVNEHEAEELAAARGLAGASAEALRDRLGADVVVTRGAAGCEVADASGTTALPALSAGPVVDTTGAGDAFVGALAAALADGAPLVEGARRGTAAGALAVAAPGAQGGDGSASAIAALLADPGDG